MKRIHFTAEDLARTRGAPTIGVAAETFDSVRMLSNRDAGLAFRGWQVSVRGRLGDRAGPLAALIPARGPLVDAMSLMGSTPSIDEAVDIWMAAPGALLRVELEHIGFRPTHRTWARGLLDGTREARLQVASALRACHRVTVAPYWSGVRSPLGEVRAGYVRAMADGGVERLLAVLGGSAARWRPPVLEVAHPRDEDVHLNGRGLVIAPTMFSTDQIELLLPPLDPSRSPTPAVGTIAWFRSGSPDLRGQSMDNRTSSYGNRTGTAFALHDWYGYGGNCWPIWNESPANLQSVNPAWDTIASSVSRGTCG
ncbi:transcriptional regulator [Streptomyces sp. NPDC087897]|uniref:transcriptional regulator n=1 Tax=Streptomyces sp. NPDC087897 TaxID=3365817 RepID=UPI0037FADBBA